MRPKQAIAKLDDMQRQIIHGKRIFGEIADMLRISERVMESIRDHPCGHKPNAISGKCEACKALKEWDALSSADNQRWEHGNASAGSAPATGSATSDVRLLREDKVWHVWIDGEHACECCDFTFNAAVDRLKARLSPNADVVDVPPQMLADQKI